MTEDVTVRRVFDDGSANNQWVGIFSLGTSLICIFSVTICHGKWCFLFGHRLPTTVADVIIAPSRRPLSPLHREPCAATLVLLISRGA